jgi:hypothetical protein
MAHGAAEKRKEALHLQHNKDVQQKAQCIQTSSSSRSLATFATWSEAMVHRLLHFPHQPLSPSPLCHH